MTDKVTIFYANLNSFFDVFSCRFKINFIFAKYFFKHLY